MIKESDFILKSYTKAELAAMYNPTQCITVALQTLSRWVRSNSMLTKELDAVGYNKYRRTYTPREVELIVKYLGEP